jgi:hypothetical protein
MKRIVLATLVALGLVACRSRAPEASAAEITSAPSPSTLERLGEPFGAAPMVALGALASDPAKYAAQRVHTEGTIKSVCQHAGCWMEIADDRGQAHVTMYGHQFAIPRYAVGRRARVDAKVVGTPRSGECEREARQANGTLPRLALEATGVELL